MLIPNTDLAFLNSDPKNHFWTTLGPKIQSCMFCLKPDARSTSRMLIPNPDLDFWNFDPRTCFWANLSPKIQIFLFCLKVIIVSQGCGFRIQIPNLGPKIQSSLLCLKIGTHSISRMLILIPTLVFWISNPNSLFGQIWAKKVKYVSIENWQTWYIEDADSYSNISFMNFEL